MFSHHNVSPILHYILAAALSLILLVGIFTLFHHLSSARKTSETQPLAFPADSHLYRFPNIYVSKQVFKLSPDDAKQISRIAQQPIAQWYGNWNADVTASIQADLSSMGQHDVATLVAYSIPNRDCNLYSKGGANDSQSYRSWIDAFAQGVGDKSVIIIVEPDALIHLDCLSDEQKNQRLALLGYAVDTFAGLPHARVYLDAGNAHYNAGVMAKLLSSPGLSKADGFSVNVSNYYGNQDSLRYARGVSQKLSNKPFVIDASRNGVPMQGGNWCNPAMPKLGMRPSLTSNEPGLDAYLWIKQPGTSDGTCNGGPQAGQWWLRNAQELTR